MQSMIYTVQKYMRTRLLFLWLFTTVSLWEPLVVFRFHVLPQAKSGGWGEGGGATHTRRLQAPVQCKSFRWVRLSRCCVCLTQNCPHFAWFQPTLATESRLIAPQLVTAELRVTAFVWNTLQSATMAAIVTPPQKDGQLTRPLPRG
jgi:hypothetical protein